MASASVSFRISRSAEDLAGTLHLLSQRLVQLEQRLAALEAQQAQPLEDDPVLLASLGNAERLLVDCRDLLAGALDASRPQPQPNSAPADPQVGDSDPGSISPEAQAGSGDTAALTGGELEPGPSEPEAHWEEARELAA